MVNRGQWKIHDLIKSYKYTSVVTEWNTQDNFVTKAVVNSTIMKPHCIECIENQQ